MTQEELHKKIDKYLNNEIAPGEGIYSENNVIWFLQLINQHVSEVIGEYEWYGKTTALTEQYPRKTRNELRHVQRERAGLENHE